MPDISQLTGLNFNTADIINSIIGISFIADYGIIDQVNSDKTINVSHAVMSVLRNGKDLPVTTTKNIEVLWPASANFGMKWPLKAGDGVLLIGLRNFIDTTKSIKKPTNGPTEFMHYTQDTMKAIPLQSVDSPKNTIEITRR